MKLKYSALAVATAALVMAGCGKKQEAAPPAAQAPASAAATTAAAPRDE